jgi:HlyD family secretion protein
MQFLIKRLARFGLLAVAVMLCGCGGGRQADTIQASGTIEATEVNVASKVGGQLEVLTFDEGAQVKVGQLLAELDHESADLQLKQAEAGVTLADAQLNLLLNGARREDVQQAEDNLKQADAALKIAEEDFNRMQALFEKASVTRKQRDDAEMRYTVARAQQSAAREAVKKVRSWARPEEVEAARARLQQARAAVDLLKKTISDSRITAPVSGTVTNKPFDVGELVSPGSTVATITNLESVHVMLYLNEQEIGHVRLGQDVAIRIDAFSDRSFPGRITYISPVAEFTPKNVQTKEDRVKLVFGVKVEMQNREGVLKPGMYADATIRKA